MPRIEIKQILCPVDLSDPSRHALHHAARLAQWYGAQIMALQVVWEAVPAQRELSAAVTVEARTWCETTEIVAAGKPHEEIIRLANEHGADTIVLGVHGRTKVDLAFFGSTANQVVRAAACPVLTIRA